MLSCKDENDKKGFVKGPVRFQRYLNLPSLTNLLGQFKVCRSIEPRTEKKRKITNKIFSSVSFFKSPRFDKYVCQNFFFFFFNTSKWKQNRRLIIEFGLFVTSDVVLCRLHDYLVVAE